MTHKSKIILFQLTFHIKTLSFSLQEVERKSEGDSCKKNPGKTVKNLPTKLKVLSSHSMSFLGNSSKTKSMSPYLATAFLLLSFAAREASGQFFRGRQFGRQIGGGAAGSNSGEECGSGQYTHFELVTGQVGFFKNKLLPIIFP